MIKITCNCGTVIILQSIKDKEINSKCIKCLQKELDKKINSYDMRKGR